MQAISNSNRLMAMPYVVATLAVRAQEKTRGVKTRIEGGKAQV